MNEIHGAEFSRDAKIFSFTDTIPHFFDFLADLQFENFFILEAGCASIIRIKVPNLFALLRSCYSQSLCTIQSL